MHAAQLEIGFREKLSHDRAQRGISVGHGEFRAAEAPVIERGQEAAPEPAGFGLADGDPQELAPTAMIVARLMILRSARDYR